MTATSDNAELLAHYEAKIQRLEKVNEDLLASAIRVRARCQSMRLDQDANAAMNDLSVAITAAKEAAIAKAEGRS